MAAFTLTQGLSLNYEFPPERMELYASPTVRRLRERGVWFDPDVFPNLSELVSVVGGLSSLLQIHENLVKVAAGQASGDDAAAKQIFDLLLKDSSESDGDTTIPPGILLIESSEDESVKVDFDRVQLRDRVKASIEGILTKSQEALKLEDLLQARVDTPLPFVARGDLYVCACGAASRTLASTCQLCGGKMDPNPRVLPEVEPHIQMLVQQDVWLELAIENLFIRQGFETVVGAKWTGMSGLEHELDVVARLPGMFTVEVEASSTGADMDEVTKVLIRREEFPFQHFALVTFGPANERATVFARFHNIALFSNIRENVQKFSDWISTIQVRHGSVPGASGTTGPLADTQLFDLSRLT
jgi:hypothetical protein